MQFLTFPFYLADALFRAVGAVLGAEQLGEHRRGRGGGSAVAAGLGAGPVRQVTLTQSG